MIGLAVVVLILALWVGGKPFKAALARASPYWRPTTGLITIVLCVLALVLALREDWPAAIGLGVVAAALALGARWRAVPRERVKAAGAMSLTDARAVLGVAPDASRADVQAAYLRLIRMAHPDLGGTRGLAAQLNTARDRLLASADE